MKPLAIDDPHGTWRAAMLLGLVTSSYSTPVASAGAGQPAGREVAVDWMVVHTIPLRAFAIEAVPMWDPMIAGIRTIHATDFGWPLVVFGLFGRRTVHLQPDLLLNLARLSMITRRLLGLVSGYCRGAILMTDLPARSGLPDSQQEGCS